MHGRVILPSLYIDRRPCPVNGRRAVLVVWPMRAPSVWVVCTVTPQLSGQTATPLETRLSCNSSQYPPDANTHSRRLPRTISRLPSTSTFFTPEPRPTATTPHLVRTAARRRQSTQYGRIRFKAAVFDLGQEGNPNSHSGTCKRRHTDNNPGDEALTTDTGQCRQDDALVQTEGTLTSGGLEGFLRSRICG